MVNRMVDIQSALVDEEASTASHEAPHIADRRHQGEL